MAAIPNSTLPGHKQLHEKVISALEVCQESKSIEFKGSSPWNDLQIGIVRTTMAMSNLEYGGLIIIGVSERNNTWTLEGLSSDHLSTYDEDNVNDFINKYASPMIQIRLVTVDYNKLTFLAVEVREFGDTPILCKRNGPDGSNFRRGDILIRPAGKPRTEKAQAANDIHDLLATSSEKRARNLIAASQRIGMIIPEDSNKHFDDELGEL